MVSKHFLIGMHIHFLRPSFGAGGPLVDALNSLKGCLSSFHRSGSRVDHHLFREFQGETYDWMFPAKLKPRCIGCGKRWILLVLRQHSRCGWWWNLEMKCSHVLGYNGYYYVITGFDQNSTTIFQIDMWGCFRRLLQVDLLPWRQSPRIVLHSFGRKKLSQLHSPGGTNNTRKLT